MEGQRMFTSEWREQVRSEIIEKAKCDTRISGGAITGSATLDQLDQWSDIDMAFGIKNASQLPEILDTYTKQMYQAYGALHHLDVHSGVWIYRVFLLSNTLQVDLAFAPEDQFGARASTFKLIFGKKGQIPFDPPTQFEVYVGWCWLYSLHVRSSLRRGRPWQTEFFVSGLRDYLISLCCRRFGLVEKQGRGVDWLPVEELSKLESTLIKSLESAELQRAFSAAVNLCLEEIEFVDKDLCARIKPAFLTLANFQRSKLIDTNGRLLMSIQILDRSPTAEEYKCFRRLVGWRREVAEFRTEAILWAA